MEGKPNISKVMGIGLGTTNSVMVLMETGQFHWPRIVPNAEGSPLTPSVVAVGKDGQRLVGQVAKRQAIVNPEDTVFSIRRFIGRKLSDSSVQHDKTLVPYKLTAAPNGDVRVVICGQDYSPSEIVAMILEKMKEDAEAYLSEPTEQIEIEQAVIAVPAYFSDSQRQATKEAARIAGLEVLRFIDEPIAAALAYGLDERDGQTIAVYDLGGGTFDISILKVDHGVFEMLSFDGDAHLGGDDFDQRIIDWVCDEFEEEHGIDLRGDRMAQQRLKEAVEKAKIELSTAVESEINLPFIAADASGPKSLHLSLTRSKLEQLVEDLTERTIEPCQRALQEAGLRVSDIDEVILAGGQANMPTVKETVKRFFDQELRPALPSRRQRAGVDPDQVVGVGAVIQAEKLEFLT